MKTNPARAARTSNRPSRPYVRTEEKSDYDYAQVGFRVYGSHARMIALAAEKESQKQGHQISVAAYLRSIVLPWVASELNVDCPEYESLDGSHDVVALAAQRAGLSVREYERRVAREHAAKEIRSIPPQRDPRRETYFDELKSSDSGMRKVILK